MGIFKKAEEILFTGKTIKDYGVIHEYQVGISKFKHSVILVEKKDQKKVILKESVTAILGASVRYFEFDRIGVQNLRDALSDAINLM